MSIPHSNLIAVFPGHIYTNLSAFNNRYNFILSIIPTLNDCNILFPGDRYAIHPMGMTLSVKMDELMLYQTIMCLSLTIIWTMNIASYVDYKKNQYYSQNKMKENKSFMKHLFRKANVFSCVFTPHDIINSKVTVGNLNRTCQEMSRRKKRDQSLSSSLTSVCIAFSICYVPLVVTQFMSKSRSINLTKYPHEFDPDMNNLFNISMFFASRLVMANSFLNGFIYSCKDRGFRVATKATVFRIKSAQVGLLNSSKLSKSLNLHFSIPP